MGSNLPLTGKRVLILVDDEYEDLELWYPRLRLLEAGAAVTVAGHEEGREYRSKHGYPCIAGSAVVNVKPAAFDGLVIPGGWAPDKLRRDPKVLGLVRAFANSGKLVAAICHGGWVCASAGVYRGVKVTGSLGIRDDLVNAGGIWEDAPAVLDRNFLSSRKPEDLPRFCRVMVDYLGAVSVTV